MENQIANYIVIPDGEKIRQSEVERFIERVKKGMVDERGFCPLEYGPYGTEGYWDNHFVNSPVKLGEYREMPDLRWAGRKNPRFQELDYQTPDGITYSMKVHIDIIKEHPEVKGLDGLLIKDAILVKLH
jgi:hypothetical protein